MPFLVGDDVGSVGVEAHTVRGAKAGREDVGLASRRRKCEQRAVMRHDGGQGMTGGLGVVEVFLTIDLQAHCELMKMLGDLVVVVEAFVVVGLAVVIGIVQDHQLIAATYEDLAIDDLDAQRLKQTRGDSTPGELRFLFAAASGFGGPQLCQPADQPHIAVPCADECRIAVAMKIDARKSHLCEPRIVDWVGEHIDGEWPAVITVHHLGGQSLRPALRDRRGVI